MKRVATFLAVVALVGCSAPQYQPLPEETDAPEADFHLPSDLKAYRVIGEVRHPGPEPYLGKTTLVQAIETAVGFTDSADRKRLVVRRRDGSVERYNYYQILEAATNSPCLEPGDTLEVKRRRFVWGK